MSDSALIISDSMKVFIGEIPQDLRRKLSLYDVDRLYRIFDAEWRRIEAERNDAIAQRDNCMSQFLEERKKRTGTAND